MVCSEEDMPVIPTIIERWNQGAAVGYDIYSRLLKDRIIFVGGYGGEVTTDSANLIIAQLLYLEAEDPDKLKKELAVIN